MKHKLSAYSFKITVLARTVKDAEQQIKDDLLDYKYGKIKLDSIINMMELEKIKGAK